MKKIVSILLSFIMLITVLTAVPLTAGAKTAMGAQTGESRGAVKLIVDGTPYRVHFGQVVDYVFYLNTSERVGSLDAETLYDAAGLDILSDFEELDTVFPVIKDSMMCNNGHPGRLIYNYSHARGTAFNTHDSELIRLRFRVSADKGVYSVKTLLHALAGYDGPIYILYGVILNTSYSFCSALYNVEIDKALEPAETDILGDADFDDELTILDATAIQRTLAGLPVDLFSAQAADADGDEEATILDATAIQRHLAGLPTNENIGKAIK